MKRALILAALLAAAAAPALAGQAVSLRPQVLDADGVVTLGDLFADAGAAAATPVAGRTGRTVMLDARAVQLAARRAGLDWANAEGLARIVVEAGGAQAANGTSASAVVRGNVEVLTYARSLASGEVVGPEDLVWGKAVAAPSDAPSDAAQVIGLAARRPLREGAVVSARDVAAAQVIKTGEMVSVTYQYDGITLTLQAKAMAAAAVGESFSVQNIDSKKVIQAVAAGPGQAIVGPAAAQLKASSTRYALR
jgi:flagella basal body P-ring formation protein FlgA